MTLRDKILSENLPDDRVALFYTGQVGFIFKFRGKYILIDGYLSDIIDRNNNFAPGWVRRYPSPITGAELDFIDYVFCTHDHTDHADPVTLGEIARVNFEYLTYGIPNKEILDLTDNPILNPPAEVLAKCETLANLGSDGDDMYSRYWKLFKAK